MKQAGATTILLAAAFLTYGVLALVESDGLLAAVNPAHAKFGRPAKPADSTTRRSTQRAARGATRSPKAHARSSKIASSHRQHAVRERQKIRLASRQAMHRKSHNRLASHGKPPRRQIATRGLASFYWEDTETASGERFDKHKLCAAHPTLPFGTRLRVTNVGNGRSVIVRVNDRGPFVRGRVVDVTSAAAEVLGMVDVGVITVTVDIVR